MSSDYVCRCSLVTQQEIEQAVEQQGVRDVEGLKDATYATAGCGKCRLMCEHIIEQTLLSLPNTK